MAILGVRLGLPFGLPGGGDNGRVAHVQRRKLDIRVQIWHTEHAFITGQLFAEGFAPTGRDWPLCLPMRAARYGQPDAPHRHI